MKLINLISYVLRVCKVYCNSLTKHVTNVSLCGTERKTPGPEIVKKVRIYCNNFIVRKTNLGGEPAPYKTMFSLQQRSVIHVRD